MTGVLLIDKPAGPTSHDIVQRLRRTSGERRIGHTGTLDPAATGLLPLVFGQATRLASLLTGASKTYEAVVRLGFATDTDDREGRPVGAPSSPDVSDEEIVRALDRFRGTFEQTPPAHSAKKVDGTRAYELARRAAPLSLRPVPVTVLALESTGRTADRVGIRVSATSGFYVRALARDLGAVLGCGAHLESLRRTASGAFRVEEALALEEAEARGSDVARALIAPADALPDLPGLVLTEQGLRRTRHGNELGPGHVAGHVGGIRGDGPVKLLTPDGRLAAIARRSGGGALHPVVVLG